MIEYFFCYTRTYIDSNETIEIKREEIMKTKSVLFNIIFGLLYYGTTVILGLFNRRILVLTMGIEYQGISGLFGNVLSMLAIAELGIGATIIFHLYRPLEEKNIELVKSLMCFYRKCYNIIAFVIIILGLILIPFLPALVPEYTLNIDLTIVYLCFLIDSVCSYLFTYKRSIMIADQKNYIVLSADLLYQFVLKLIQIIIIIYTHNFLLYLIIMPICRIIENLLLNKVVAKKYPFLTGKNNIKLPEAVLQDIKKKVKGTVFHKLGTFVVLGTDNILLSHFFGLAVVGIYSNYSMILDVLKNISSQFVVAATAGVGHLLVGEDKENINSIFEQLQLLNAGIMNFVATGIYCLITPVIKILFGSQYTFSESLVFVLTIKFYITGMRQVYSIFKETAGILYEDRFIPLIESLINILFSLILLHFFGPSGVFWGTIISSLILFCYTYPILVYKGVLNRKILDYYKQLFFLFGIMLLSLIATKYIVNKIFILSLGGWLISVVGICCIVPNCIYYFLYARRQKDWQKLMKRVVRICQNVIRRESK